MAAASKFLFDLSFDGPSGPAGAPQSTRGPVTPAEPTFSRADLAAVEAKARAEGHAAGRAEAISQHEAQVAAALATIGRSVTVLLAARDEMRSEGERQSLELCTAIIPKLFPTLTKYQGFAEIAAMVARCMREAIEEPRLVLRLPDALFEGVRAQLDPLAAATGFAGKLVILGDEALSGADCRVEWADGGVERDLGRTWREIEAAIVRAIEAPPSERPAEASSNELSEPSQLAAAGGL
jgi:flagellar assembly protein FliH